MREFLAAVFKGREWEWARSRHVGGERGANNGSNGMGVMMMSQVLLLLV